MRQRIFRRGFTLIELLVVIGIIAILFSILLPTIISIRRNAEKNAARMELQTISVALDAYRADFKDYPRPPVNPANPLYAQYRVLAWALIGPYDASKGTVVDPIASKVLNDGADGLGFRTVYDPNANAGSGAGGKVWGPYLPADKFKLLTAQANPDFTTTPTDLRWDLADRYGAPIEYFPRWRNYQPGANLFGVNVTTAARSVYDYRQQWQADPKKPADSQSPLMKYLRRALGDDYIGKDASSNSPGTAPNDVIDAKESPKDMPPFILVSRGPSKAFPHEKDPDATLLDKDLSFRFEKCDAITNLQH